MIIEGILKRKDIGPGVWVLESKDQTWTLKGSVPKHQENQRMRLEGEPEQSFGFAMTGPVFVVYAVV